MFKVSVFYPKQPGTSFDLPYYQAQHMGLVKKLMMPEGLVKVGVEGGYSAEAPGSEPPYHCVGHLYFSSLDAYWQATKKHIKDLGADMPNFTDARPFFQVNEVISEFSMEQESSPIKVNVMYPVSEESQFDIDYYRDSHMTLVKEQLQGKGLVGTAVDKGISGTRPNDPPPYHCIGQLVFETEAAFREAMPPVASTLRGDIPNFTNTTPERWISRLLE